MNGEISGEISGVVKELKAWPSIGPDVKGTHVTLTCDVGYVAFTIPLGEPVPGLHDRVVIDWEAAYVPEERR